MAQSLGISVPLGAPDAAPVGKAGSILAAAERTFLARGFGAVSMDMIAREANASKATVYAHFASKEELFGAVIARVSERRFGSFSAEALDPNEVAASLLTIARRFLDLVLSPEAIAVNRIVIGEVARFSIIGDVFWEAGPARTRSQIEAFLRRAVAAGTLAVPDTRLAAEQFAALARGELHLRQLLQPQATLKAEIVADAARNAVGVFMRAFGVRSSAPAAAREHR
jgi:AcrR family transcriptional regulator